MDLTDFIPNDKPIEVLIKNPINDEPLFNKSGSEMSITVLSKYSREFKKIAYDLSSEQDKEDTEDFGKKIIIKSILSWDITYEGKKVKLTEDKAKEVFDRLPWVADQVANAIWNEEAFIVA